MAQLRATQFFIGNVTTVAPVNTNVYTVPAGHRIILKSIAVRNLNPSAGVTWFVVIDSTLVFTNLLGPGSTSSSGSFEWRPWIVIGPGSVLKLTCSASTGIGCVVSGAYHYI